jgi:S1-C subfamily serine protease
MTGQSGENMGLALSRAAADAVERAGQVTVLVNARRRMPFSGLLVGQDLILTASHGVERESEIQILLPDGSEGLASLAGRDRGTDLAVLRLGSAVSIPPADLSGGEGRVGSLVVALGRPSSEGVQASFGMINAVGSGLRTHGGAILDRYLITSAVPYPGFSGGPLVDLSGAVVGINTSGLVRGMLLGIPARAAAEAARNLAQHGRIRRGYLGIRSQVVELPQAARGPLGREQATGLLLVGVEAQGPAASGALMVGDILVGMEGQPVADHDDLLSRLSGDLVGKAAAVQVVRGGKLETVTVTVGEKE